MGYISHDIWIADETELKANANKRKRYVVVQEVKQEEDAYTLEKVNQKRMAYHKKALSSKPGKVVIKETIQSLTDPDAGLSVKHDKFARYHGVQKVTIQVLMTAISQNLKKWARLRFTVRIQHRFKLPKKKKR
ncbi:hypothetical protein OH784_26570 [Ectobacillus funiculus]|uniref:hypothetical protein n=1 Tax=Ectobacillus funiculus TaxID=137993 RepID=UPI00397AE84A